MYELELPKRGGDTFNIMLKELDEATYIAVSNLVKAGKDVEATKLLLRQLHSGGDNIEDVVSDFVAVHSAMRPILEILTPLEATLKKSSLKTK